MKIHLNPVLTTDLISGILHIQKTHWLWDEGNQKSKKYAKLFGGVVGLIPAALCFMLAHCQTIMASWDTWKRMEPLLMSSVTPVLFLTGQNLCFEKGLLYMLHWCGLLGCLKGQFTPKSKIFWIPIYLSLMLFIHLDRFGASCWDKFAFSRI